MAAERLEYATKGAVRRKAGGGWGWIVGGLLCLPVGFLIAAYGVVGALFVSGAVQRGEAGAGWGGVCFLVGVAIAGVALMGGGIVLMGVGAGAIEGARVDEPGTGEGQGMKEEER